MRLVVTALLFAALLHSTPSAQDRLSLDDPKVLQQWMTFYYQHPDPQRFADAMFAASRLGLLHQDKTAPPMLGFLAGWFSDNDNARDAAVEKLIGLPGDDLLMLIAGLWYSDSPGSLKVLENLTPRLPAQAARIKESLANPSHGITGLALEQGPWVLDALWGNFFATGNEAPVVRIMTALPWGETKDNAMGTAVGMAAKWSLTSNAVQHPRVLEICRSQLAKQPKDVARILTQVIKDAEKELKKKGETRAFSWQL